MQDINQALT